MADDEETEVGQYNPSILHVNFPSRDHNGEFALVGDAYQPLSIKAPEGWRTYPGSTYPVRQKQPDGTWKDVLWAPSAGT